MACSAQMSAGSPAKSRCQDLPTTGVYRRLRPRKYLNNDITRERSQNLQMVEFRSCDTSLHTG